MTKDKITEISCDCPSARACREIMETPEKDIPKNPNIPALYGNWERGFNNGLNIAKSIIDKHTADKPDHNVDEISEDFGIIDGDAINKKVSPLIRELAGATPDDKLPTEITDKPNHNIDGDKKDELAKKIKNIIIRWDVKWDVFANWEREVDDCMAELVEKIQPLLQSRPSVTVDNRELARAVKALEIYYVNNIGACECIKESGIACEICKHFHTILDIQSLLQFHPLKKLSYCDFTYHKFDKRGICIFCGYNPSVTVDVEKIISDCCPIKQNIDSSIHRHPKPQQTVNEQILAENIVAEYDNYKNYKDWLRQIKRVKYYIKRATRHLMPCQCEDLKYWLYSTLKCGVDRKCQMCIEDLEIFLEQYPEWKDEDYKHPVSTRVVQLQSEIDSLQNENEKLRQNYTEAETELAKVCSERNDLKNK